MNDDDSDIDNNDAHSEGSAYASVASGYTMDENDMRRNDNELDVNNQFEQFVLKKKEIVETESVSSSYLYFSRQGSISEASKSFLSVGGTNALSDTHSVYDYEEENQDTDDFDFYNKNDECFFCFRDGHKTHATHICHSCKPGGRYMCHICLQSHNKFCEHHDVTSLSVKCEQQLESLSKQSEDKEDTKGLASYNEVQTESKNTSRNTILQADKDKVDQSGKLEDSEKKGYQEMVTGYHTKVRRLKQEIVQSTRRGSNENTDYLRFFKDTLLTNIACDQQTKVLDHNTKVTKYGSYNIRNASDPKRCFITSIIQLDSNRLVLADCENKSLKLINAKTYQLISTKSLERYPSVVCALDDNKAAVILDYHIVCILHIGKEIELDTMFITGTDCNSIASDNGGLLVCFPDKIVQYNYTGEEVKCINPQPLDKAKKTYHFKHIVCSTDRKYVYVTDMNNGIIQFDKNGVLLWAMLDSKISKPSTICIDPKGIIYVTDTSNGAFQIMMDNETKSGVIHHLQDIENPISLCYETTHNRLVVGQWCSDVIQVFSIL